MNFSIATSALLLILAAASTLAQDVVTPPSNLPTTMEERGASIGATSPSATLPSSQLQQIETDVPTAQLSRIAQQPVSEVGGKTRSAKDAEIYRVLSPSVVEILTQDGFGSGLHRVAV